MKKKNSLPPTGYAPISEMPHYYVNEHGNIFNIRSGKILKQSISQPCGYIRHNLTDCGRRLSFRLHSLVAQYFIGPRPKGMQVNHIDGNKTNNHVSNLEYVTPKQNNIHALKLQLRKNWVYSQNDNEFLYDFKQKSAVDLEEKYGVSQCAILLKANKILDKQQLEELRIQKIKKSTKGKLKKTSKALIVYKNGVVVGEYGAIFIAAEKLKVPSYAIHRHLIGYKSKGRRIFYDFFGEEKYTAKWL